MIFKYHYANKRKQTMFMKNRIRKSTAFSGSFETESPENYQIVQEIKEIEPNILNATTIEEKIDMIVF